jgi:hypothetical protein
MGLDWGAVAVTRDEVQTAADAAAMVATTSLTDRPEAVRRAQAYAAQVVTNGVPVVVDDADVVVGTWRGGSFTATSTNPDAVRVSAHADLPMTLTRFFGVDSVRISAVGGAGVRIVRHRAPDLVLALDVTDTMTAADLTRQRTAAQAMVDCVVSRATPDSRIGIVVYTGLDAIRSPMLTVGDGYAGLSSLIAGIHACGTPGMPTCLGENQAAGMGSAMVMLAEAGTPDGVGQAILLESAGLPHANGICVAANYDRVGWRPELRALCGDLGGAQPTDATYRTWADGYSASAEASAIDIYTVYYGTDAAGILYLADHIASGSGTSASVTRGTAMDTAFEGVCSTFATSASGMIF